MFDAGFLEMLLIGVIALLVIGPERLPGIAAKVGRWVAKARAFVATTRSDIERELQTDELKKALDVQRREIESLRDSISEQTHDASQSLKSQLNEAQDLFSDEVALIRQQISIRPDESEDEYAKRRETPEFKQMMERLEQSGS